MTLEKPPVRGIVGQTVRVNNHISFYAQSVTLYIVLTTVVQHFYVNPVYNLLTVSRIEDSSVCDTHLTSWYTTAYYLSFSSTGMPLLAERTKTLSPSSRSLTPSYAPFRNQHRIYKCPVVAYSCSYPLFKKFSEKFSKNVINYNHRVQYQTLIRNR